MLHLPFVKHTRFYQAWVFALCSKSSVEGFFLCNKSPVFISFWTLTASLPLPKYLCTRTQLYTDVTLLQIEERCKHYKSKWRKLPWRSHCQKWSTFCKEVCLDLFAYCSCILMPGTITCCLSDFCLPLSLYILLRKRIRFYSIFKQCILKAKHSD